MRSAWKNVRYRIEWLAVLAALKLVPLLSRQRCYQLGGWIGAMAARLDRRGREVARANLDAAFGDAFSGERKEAIVRESYQHVARAMLDLLWSPRLTRETYSRYVEFENWERMKAEIAPAQSCIWGAFHYGNFEWLSLAVAWAGFPSAVVMQNFKNSLLDDILRKLREQSGHTTVMREGAIIRLFKVLRKSGRVALLVDTTVPASQPSIVIECFGLKTMVTVAHAWLQERANVPLIPIYCEPLNDGRYRVVALPKVQPPAGTTHRDVAQACWDAFEPVVRRDPAPWLWMYKHWRNKPAGATNYPFYANESAAFDQIAANDNYAKLDRAALVWPA